MRLDKSKYFAIFVVIILFVICSLIDKHSNSELVDNISFEVVDNCLVNDDEIVLSFDITDDADFYIEKDNPFLEKFLDEIFVDPSMKAIREHDIEIDKEMDIISEFIRSKNKKLSSVLSDIISYHIKNKSIKANLPPELIVGITKVESHFDPSATSNKGAKGLMQVLDKECEGKKIDHSRLYEIDYNIECGIDILNSKLKYSKGDIKKALYLYVGKDEEYAGEVLKIMGEFRFFRSQILASKS